MDYISSLQETIKRLHGCDSSHIKSVPVTEIFKGKIVWDGMVEVFALNGHTKAQKCYAWGYKGDTNNKNFVTVLEIPPVESAKTAVQAAIVSESKK